MSVFRPLDRYVLRESGRGDYYDHSGAMRDMLQNGRRFDVVVLDPTDPTAVVGLNPLAKPLDPELAADNLLAIFKALYGDYLAGPLYATSARADLDAQEVRVARGVAQAEPRGSCVAALAPPPRTGTTGGARTGTTGAAVLTATSPLFAVPFSIVFLGERGGWRLAAGAASSVAGRVQRSSLTSVTCRACHA